MKPTIVADSHIPFLKGILEPYATVIYAGKGEISRELASKADGIIIRTRTTCDENLLEGTPVQFIATATIGHDHIDTLYCEAKSIRWHHAPGCNSSSVMQYLASALSALSNDKHFNLYQKRIGIIGAGNVGSKVARLAGILGMVPLINDPPRERKEGPAGYVSFEEILKTAEVITLHVPLSFDGPDKTYHLADGSFFDSLSSKPILINTARGPVVDTRMIKKALRNNQVSGYIADVWENEPNIDSELLHLTDIATPHIAGYSLEGKANGTAACVQAASRFFGFGIDSWYPPDLPLPANPFINITTGVKTDEQVISEAILSTYDILKDDRAFRTNPSTFEELRNYYPNRREFEAFTIVIQKSRPTLVQKLKDIGFMI